MPLIALLLLTSCTNASGAWWLDTMDYQAGEPRRGEHGETLQPKEMGR